MSFTAKKRYSTRKEPRWVQAPLSLAVRQVLGVGFAFATVGAAAQQVEQTTQTEQVKQVKQTEQTSNNANARTLSAVVVYGQAESIGNLQKTYSGGQLARGGDLGILGRTDLMKVPFSSTNYTSELIENQQGLAISDVVMNDASVRTLQARGGYGDDFQVRGYNINNRDVSMNGLFGLSPATRVPLEMVERVEVLKGPGSLTNGVGPNGSVGGSVNVVTKRAHDVPLTRLTLTYMGKAQFGTHLDVGRRFGENNEWGVRANGVWRNGEGNVDGGRSRLGLGSLGLDYAGERLRASVDLLYTEGSTNSFRPQAAFLAGITQVPAVPDARKSWYPGASMDEQAKTVMGKIEYDINERTTAYASVGHSETETNQHFPTASPRINSAGDFGVRNGYYDEYNKTTSADIGVRTKFSTGAVNHTVVLAANSMERETGYFYQLTGTSAASNIYNPSALPPINFARGTPARSSELKQHSVALADTMGFFNDRLLATVGVRNQTIDSRAYSVTTGAVSGTPYKASAVTPLVGLVFLIDRNTSLYYNYTAGLSAGGVASSTATPAYQNAGQTFPPQKSKQNEIGLKKDWGTLMTQIALYELKKPGAMDVYDGSGLRWYTFGGEQRNRGIELTAYGELQRGLRLMASAAFTDAKMTRTANGINQGKDATGVPPRTYNLGLDWDTPWVPGLSLNGRVIHTSAMWYDSANTLRMPSWTRVDVGARYASQLAGKKVVYRANIENVADKGYWVTASGYVTVGAPRTLMLSATMDF